MLPKDVSTSKGMCVHMYPNSDFTLPVGKLAETLMYSTKTDSGSKRWSEGPSAYSNSAKTDKHAE